MNDRVNTLDTSVGYGQRCRRQSASASCATPTGCWP